MNAPTGIDRETIVSPNRRPGRGHLAVAAGCAAVLLLSALLEVRADERIELEFLKGRPFPHVCAMRRLFDFGCPGCGLTRSFIHLAHGRVAESYNAHRLGWLIAVVVAAQIPWRMYLSRRPAVARLESKWQAVLGWTVFALLIANWLVRVIETISGHE